MISILKTTCVLALLCAIMPVFGTEEISSEIKPYLGLAVQLDTFRTSEAPQTPFSFAGISAETANVSTGGFSIDPTIRQISRAFYNSVFTGSKNIETGWSGDASNPGCDADSTTQAFQDVVLARVNFFRAMAGIPASMILNSSWSAKAQEAALMFSVNNSLSHDPPENWLCYTENGNVAAGRSNISWGNHGSSAVLSQMRDNGPNNDAVGHRRWILNPWANQIGTGDIPSGDQSEAHSLWIIPDYDPAPPPRPPARDFYVAWPPPGYVPYQLVFPRWSFSYPEADFNNANVSMTRGGSNIGVTQEAISNGFGENTIVWYPQGTDPDAGVSDFEPVNGDETYTVSIEGVMLDGSPVDFGYTVTVIDPNVPEANEEKPVVDGSTYGLTGQMLAYTVTPMSFANEHSFTSCEVMQQDYINDAESGLAGIVDGTSAAYSAVIGSVGIDASNAFHLATPSPPNPVPGDPDIIKITNAFVPSFNSVLKFKSKLGLATTSQVAKAQISIDDGVNWITLWEQTGNGSTTDSSYISRSVSLAEYQGRPIRVQFTFGIAEGLTSWNWFNSTSSSTGFLIDDIEITDADEIDNCSTVSLGTETAFDFTPFRAGSYILYVTSYAWTGYSGVGISDALYLTSYAPELDSDGDGIINFDDDFIDNVAAAADTDGDGMPDDFLPACESACQSGSGLVLDNDDDNDGIPDAIDPNPLVPGPHPMVIMPIIKLLLE